MRKQNNIASRGMKSQNLANFGPWMGPHVLNCLNLFLQVCGSMAALEIAVEKCCVSCAEALPKDQCVIWFDWLNDGLLDWRVDCCCKYIPVLLLISLCFYETAPVRGQHFMPSATRHAFHLQPNARIFFLVPSGAKKLVLAARPAFVLPRILPRSQIWGDWQFCFAWSRVNKPNFNWNWVVLGYEESNSSKIQPIRTVALEAFRICWGVPTCQRAVSAVADWSNSAR